MRSRAAGAVLAPEASAALRVRAEDVAHCRERRHRIEATFNDQARGLRGQTQQARQRLALQQSDADAHAHRNGQFADAVSTARNEVQLARQRQADLERAYRDTCARRQACEASSSSSVPTSAESSANPEVLRLRELARQYDARHDELRRQLGQRGSGDCQQLQLSKEVQRLRELLAQEEQELEHRRFLAKDSDSEYRASRNRAQAGLEQAQEALKFTTTKLVELRNQKTEEWRLQGRGPELSAAGLSQMRREAALLQGEIRHQEEELGQLQGQVCDRDRQIAEQMAAQESQEKEAKMAMLQAGSLGAVKSLGVR